MDTENLTTALFEKMKAEQDQYRARLVTQPPEEILKHAYEFIVREEILIAVESNNLTDLQAAALLNSFSPLKDVYKAWKSEKEPYIEKVGDTIEHLANRLIRQEEELCKAPLYPHSFQYAYEHGETEQCTASNRANIACKDAIVTAINKNYREYCLDTAAAVKEVVQQFGFERMLYVLANTLQTMTSDGRISQANKQWAQSIPVVFEQGKRDMRYLITRSHPGLLDMFASEARHEHLLRQPLKAADIKAEAEHIMQRLQSEQEPNSPNGTHYMAQISPDFLARASTKDTDRLMSMLPFQSLSFSGLEGRKGTFALISQDENRFQKLVLRKPSVRKKLQEKSDAPKPTKKCKANEQER